MNDPHHTLILWLALGACGPESYVASEPLNPSPDQLLGQLTTAAPFDAGHAPEPPQCEPYTFSGCYWMENHSGAYCWVPSPYSADPERCFQLDSCDGGLGHSGGGCYKWADCSDCERQPW